MQQADQGSVISELNEVSVKMETSTTISVQEEWGQNTSLRRACVGVAKSNSHKTSPPSKGKSRMSLCQNVPTLMKATADDESPCPGYLFEEIGKISQESTGCGQFLLEYLLKRQEVESCHVKIKVLKIFVHLCGHGLPHFLTELGRKSTFIQQASQFSGPPDPIHGIALYQKVRATAQDIDRLLFTDTASPQSSKLAMSSRF
ncbi:AP-4 complex accessory subunit tepsin-like [Oncorhynchus nerka]|uniref:AP-4 complex accessory subunit tepsin-like n=1 Tax=Oncorhynchus nerka TaxID=8023 RepID=UPI0031B88B2D